MGSYQRIYHYICCLFMITLSITYRFCYVIEMNPYGNLMYPSLSTSSSSSGSSPETESFPTSHSTEFTDNFDKLDSLNPYYHYRHNNYDYYNHPKMSKRADLRDLSIHSDMAFIRKLFDQKNHELLRLG
ncbi:hypothetical protein MN116_006880 [Schistosoma mekongi]|uniref:Uncharacterized protein n=1 Tax=Schistosoma mekongi TaxID=38744 RepID=A0AAE2D2X7_SCHME|nr:hypothetical protein MN116_006880 [Schistosoma mekongi]